MNARLSGHRCATLYAVSFETYWPQYLRRHSHRTNRMLHLLGWLLLLATIVIALVARSLVVLAVGVTASYAIAWTGHFIFQRETPETFRYPIFANVASLRMFVLMATGSLRPHLTRHGVE